MATIDPTGRLTVPPAELDAGPRAMVTRELLDSMEALAAFYRFAVELKCDCRCSCHIGVCRSPIERDTLDCANACRADIVAQCNIDRGRLAPYEAMVEAQRPTDVESAFLAGITTEDHDR